MALQASVAVAEALRPGVIALCCLDGFKCSIHALGRSCGANSRWFRRAETLVSVFLCVCDVLGAIDNGRFHKYKIEGRTGKQGSR